MLSVTSSTGRPSENSPRGLVTVDTGAERGPTTAETRAPAIGARLGSSTTPRKLNAATEASSTAPVRLKADGDCAEAATGTRQNNAAARAAARSNVRRMNNSLQAFASTRPCSLQCGGRMRQAPEAFDWVSQT